VPVDVWVRGICALRPGVPGLSETVRVRSVLGRFLEHSRVFAFENGGEPEVWLGSADLMHRNLDRRVEALVTVTDRTQRDELIALLDRAMDAGTHAWALDGDGTWTRSEPGPGETLLDIQTHLVRSRRWRTVDD
jgi:polyphosphate kinase